MMPTHADKKIRFGNIIRVGLLCILLLISSSAAFAGQVVAIVHPSNNVTEISVEDLKKVFMINRKKWSDGTSIVVILSPWGSNEMNVLTTRIIKCSDEMNLKKYYLTAIFQQKITEIPTSARNNLEAVRMVAGNVGSIAVVDESTIPENNGVKVVKINGL